MKTKSFSLAVLMLGTWFASAAQDPSVSASVPTVNPGQVKSAFSDAYTAFTKWDRQHGATMETIQINGSDNVLKFEGDYVAVSVGGRNLADMEYLHADVYSPVEGGVSQVRFGFAEFSGGEKYADAYLTDTPAGQWTPVDIPLSAFNGYNFSNAQVFRMTMTKTPGNVFYMDNVYFYVNSGEPDPDPVDPTPVTGIKSAPVPPNAASTVKSVYSDSYVPVCSFNFAGGNSGIAEEEIAITESDKARRLTGYNWVKYEIGSVDASDMVYIHADIYTPTTDGCTSIQPVLVNGTTSYYTGSPELTKGKWTHLNVKLADFTAKGLDVSAINEIRFKHGATGTIIIDNVYFSLEEGNKGTSDGGGPGTEPDPGPGTGLDIPLAPVPQHPASDVKTFFSDAYTDGFGKWNPTTYSAATVEILDHAEGQKVTRITKLDWAAIELGQRDVTDKGYLHIDLYTPSTSKVETLSIGVQNWSASNGSMYETEGGVDKWHTLTGDNWISLDIPLGNFPGYNFKENMAVLRIRKTGSGNTLYIDNVYFWGSPSGGDDFDPDKYPAIQDATAGELPPMDEPMLGVNLSSASGGTVPGVFGTNYMYPRLEDLYYFKAKGCRLIRFPFRAARVVEDILNPSLDTGQGAKSDIEAMKTVVAEAERLGMWIFLDAHDYAERTIDGTQYLLGEGEYTIERFATMWGIIAEAFKDYTNIWGYDLQNEPKVTAPVLVEAYQAAIDEIRKHDRNAQIIVEGTNWASAYEWIYGDRSDKQYPEYTTEVAWSYKQNSPWLLAGLVDPENKIVFQAHGYFDKDNSGTYQSGYQEVDYRKRFLPFLEWCKTNSKKGLMGEFGVPYNEHATGDERYMEVLDGAMQLFREYQVNATYWCAGAMYEANSLSCQPDKNSLYGNYAVEKSTMKVLEKYFNNWNLGQSGVENVTVSDEDTAEGDSLTYNIAGQVVDASYKGIVIRNGKKYIQK